MSMRKIKFYSFLWSVKRQVQQSYLKLNKKKNTNPKTKYIFYNIKCQNVGNEWIYDWNTRRESLAYTHIKQNIEGMSLILYKVKPIVCYHFGLFLGFITHSMAIKTS